MDLTYIRVDDIDHIDIEDEPTLALYSQAEPPETDLWQLPLLECYDVNKKIRQWQITYKDGSLIIEHGLKSGQHQVETRKVKKTKLDLPIKLQAWRDAKSRYLIQTRKGYVPAGTSDINYFKVMRGKNYERTRHSWPVFVDCKADGFRHYIKMELGQVVIRSREGIVRQQLTHFNKTLAEVMVLLPPDSVLDVEIYCHGMKFEDISSAIKISVSDQLTHQLEVWIFDVAWDFVTPFEQRRAALEQAVLKLYQLNDVTYRLSPGRDVLTTNLHDGTTYEVTIGQNLHVREPCLIRLMTGWVIDDYTQMTTLLNRVIRPLLDHAPWSYRNSQRGFEGLMIKRLSNGAHLNSQGLIMSQYKCGKNSHIFKLKIFSDMEALCIDVVETNDEPGHAILVMELTNGQTFRLKMRGPKTDRVHMFNHPEMVIGKMVNFTYQNLTNKGVPRFPVGRYIREDL